jgi:hypothetical protein
MKPFMTKTMAKHLDNISHCQFCDSTKNVVQWVPGGPMCVWCKGNLNLIRKHKLGIPDVRKGKFSMCNGCVWKEEGIK